MFLIKLQNDRILDIGCGQFYEMERFNALCYLYNLNLPVVLKVSIVSQIIEENYIVTKVYFKYSLLKFKEFV